MDESCRKNAQNQPPDYLPVMVRALASAAIFGVIGGYLGRWMGTHGNAPGSDMARPMMKWGMAGFWGMLAAYCSLKAEQQPVPQPAFETLSAQEDAATSATSNHRVMEPSAQVLGDSIALAGELAPSPQASAQRLV